MKYMLKTVVIGLFSIDFVFLPPRQYPDSPRHHPDTPRHHPDTIQTPPHIGVLRIRGHCKNNAISKWYDQIWFVLDSQYTRQYPESPKHPPDTVQTPSRHPTDTPKFSTFWLWRKGNSLIWQLLFNCLWFIWHLYSPRHLPHTPRYDPDTHRHHPDTPQTQFRHPQA